MKTIITVLFIPFLLFSCEKEEIPDPQTLLVRKLVGTYINTEWTVFTWSCGYDCKWVYYDEYKDRPEYNITIEQVEEDKVEVHFLNSGKFYAIDFKEASNGIYGQIPLQTQSFGGEIGTFEGYGQWILDGEYYSISYQDGIIDLYYILDGVLLINIQGVKL